MKNSNNKKSDLGDRIVNRKGDSFSFFSHLMQGNVSRNFPVKKSSMSRWEIEELDRVNEGRAKDSRLNSLTTDMYNANRLMRYVPEELRGVRVYRREG